MRSRLFNFLILKILSLVARDVLSLAVLSDIVLISSRLSAFPFSFGPGLFGVTCALASLVSVTLQVVFLGEIMIIVGSSMSELLWIVDGS